MQENKFGCQQTNLEQPCLDKKHPLKHAFKLRLSHEMVVTAVDFAVTCSAGRVRDGVDKGDVLESPR